MIQGERDKVYRRQTFTSTETSLRETLCNQVMQEHVFLRLKNTNTDSVIKHAHKNIEVDKLLMVQSQQTRINIH